MHNTGPSTEQGVKKCSKRISPRFWSLELGIAAPVPAGPRSLRLWGVGGAFRGSSRLWRRLALLAHGRVVPAAALSLHASSSCVSPLCVSHKDAYHWI